MGIPHDPGEPCNMDLHLPPKMVILDELGLNSILGNVIHAVQTRAGSIPWGSPAPYKNGLTCGKSADSQPNFWDPRVHQDMSEIVGVKYTTMFGDPGREFLQSGLVLHWSQDSQSVKFVFAEGRENIGSVHDNSNKNTATLLISSTTNHLRRIRRIGSR